LTGKWFGRAWRQNKYIGERKFSGLETPSQVERKKTKIPCKLPYPRHQALRRNREKVWFGQDSNRGGRMPSQMASWGCVHKVRGPIKEGPPPAPPSKKTGPLEGPTVQPFLEGGAPLFRWGRALCTLLDKKGRPARMHKRTGYSIRREILKNECKPVFSRLSI